MRGSGHFVAVPVCRTQLGSGQAGAFFKYGTHLVPVVLLKLPVNLAPRIHAVPVLQLSGTEDPLEAELLLRADDPEGDAVRWQLQAPLPSHGTAKLEAATGRLTYRSLAGRIGSDVVRVIARDQPSHPFVASNWSAAELRIELRTIHNRPFLLVKQNGNVVVLVMSRTRLRAAVAVTPPLNGSCTEADELELLALDWDPVESVEFHLQSKDSSLFIIEQLPNSTRPELNTTEGYPPMTPDK